MDASDADGTPLVERATGSPGAVNPVLSARDKSCVALTLPAGGILYIPGSNPITLTDAASFRPLCQSDDDQAIFLGAGPGASDTAEAAVLAARTGVTLPTSTLSAATATGTVTVANNTAVDNSNSNTTPQYSDFRDPFYASTFPQCYALASTTVVAYTLVIMLFITPKSFLDGGVVVLGRRGFTDGGSGGQNIGGRPWLQKVAALTVAISLTIATADTFRVAESQYFWGIQNAKELQDEVLDSTELKVIRIISNTFVLLAQAQTLIRLFPRQREKVIIKWTAFSLITLDVIFGCLNSFLYTASNHSFTNAIPALSYLFELSLGVLYAAWVIYYSLMKKRYAYYHPRMRNMCLVAALSLIAILVPIVFFVLDICKPDFTGWGDYVLWVGAAAASVIVWEWVERIEALEREEKKDGILGREVFDGDDMLNILPSNFAWPHRRRGRRNTRGGPKNSGGGATGGSSGETTKTSGRSILGLWPVATVANRHRQSFQRRRIDNEAASGQRGVGSRDTTARGPESSIPLARRSGAAAAEAEADAVGNNNTSLALSPATTRHSQQPPLWPSRPIPIATPVSRTDSASADSTVYVTRYHPVADSVTGWSQQHAQTPQSTQGTPNIQNEQHAPQGNTTLSRSNSLSSASLSTRALPSHADPSAGRGHPGSQEEPHPAEATSIAGGERTAEAAGRSTDRPWRAFARVLPFGRGGGSGTAAALPAIARSEESMFSPGDASGIRWHGRLSSNEDTGRWDLRARMEEFAMMQAERLREKIRPTVDTTGLPVLVIPAPQRQGAMLARVLEEEEAEERRRQQQQELQEPQEPQELPLQRSIGSSSDNVSFSETSSVLESALGSGPVPIPAAHPSRPVHDERPAAVAAALSGPGVSSSRGLPP